MPIVIGFANHRKNCLEKELSKFSYESKQLGAKSLAVFGDFTLNRIKPDTPLDLLIIQETEEQFFNRDEFFENFSFYFFSIFNYFFYFHIDNKNSLYYAIIQKYIL